MTRVCRRVVLGIKIKTVSTCYWHLLETSQPCRFPWILENNIITCAGEALNTVNAHAGDAETILFGSCFYPFVQRVWVAFEYLGIPYQVRPMIVSFVSTQTGSSLTLYPPCVTVHTVELTLLPPPDIRHRSRLTRHTNEVDPYKKPADFFEFSSKGLVPGLKSHTYTDRVPSTKASLSLRISRSK